MAKIDEITIRGWVFMKKGDRVIVRENIKFYKNRTGKIVDTCIYNNKPKHKVVLSNFNDIPMWFYEDELYTVSVK